MCEVAGSTLRRAATSLSLAPSFPALLRVLNNMAGPRTPQTREGRVVFFNYGKILEHNGPKIEHVHWALIWGTLLLWSSLLGNTTGVPCSEAEVSPERAAGTMSTHRFVNHDYISMLSAVLRGLSLNSNFCKTGMTMRLLSITLG